MHSPSSASRSNPHSIHGVIPFHGLVSLLGLGSQTFPIRMQP